MRLSSASNPGIIVSNDPYPIKYDDTFVTVISSFTANVQFSIGCIQVVKSKFTLT